MKPLDQNGGRISEFSSHAVKSILHIHVGIFRMADSQMVGSVVYLWYSEVFSYVLPFPLFFPLVRSVYYN